MFLVVGFFFAGLVGFFLQRVFGREKCCRDGRGMWMCLCLPTPAQPGPAGGKQQWEQVGTAT